MIGGVARILIQCLLCFGAPFGFTLNCGRQVSLCVQSYV